MAQISLELHIFKPHIIKKGNPGTRVLSLQKPKPIRCKKPGFKPGSGIRVPSLIKTHHQFILPKYNTVEIADILVKWLYIRVCPEPLKMGKIQKYD